jgi:hypothetical protein
MAAVKRVGPELDAGDWQLILLVGLVFLAPLAGAAIRSGINGINFVQQTGQQCFGYL